MDLRGVVTHVCPCGSDTWKLYVKFYDYEIAWYGLDMECAACGSMATAPTPLDNPEYQED